MATITATLAQVISLVGWLKLGLWMYGVTVPRTVTLRIWWGYAQCVSR